MAGMAAVVVLVLGTAGSEGDEFQVRVHQAPLAAAACHALAGAARRLGQPGCAAILFYDGRAEVRCREGGPLAVTHVGSHVVHLCPRFVALQRRDPGWAEATLIHEALHTLGLGENPPSSGEITGRVVRRCGR